ncbi:MAG: hypothetical protein ACI4E2_07275 [Acetatifactor sp.]
MLPTDDNIKIIENRIERAYFLGEFEQREIYIFGCTLYATDIISNLTKYGINICGFIDNDSSKQGSICSGLMVYKPVCLKEKKLDKLLVIIASPNYCYEMKGQLQAMGLTEENIFVIEVKDSSDVCEVVSEDLLQKRILDVEIGIKKYNELSDANGDEILLFPYPGTGDIYIACGFLAQYLKKNNKRNPLFVVTKENCKRVAELFGYTNIMLIEEEAMKKILLAWQFLGKEKIKIKPLLFWGWDTKYYYRNYRANKGLSFIDYFKYDVFGLNEIDEFKHPVYKKDEKYLRKLFDENELTPGKTVILAPYAGSFVSAVTINIWERIVSKLKRSGYSLCTNCFGKELPIPGTTAVQVPYSEVVNVLEYAGGFIGVRSGLCDIASRADCRMLIIYESNYLASDYEYFSIKKMGLNDKVQEIEYYDEIDLLSKIVDAFG